VRAVDEYRSIKFSDAPAMRPGKNTHGNVCVSMISRSRETYEAGVILKEISHPYSVYAKVG
jgi:hypothetical protein